MLSTEAFLVSLLLLLPVVQADANLTVSGVVRRIEKVSRSSCLWLVWGMQEECSCICKRVTEGSCKSHCMHS